MVVAYERAHQPSHRLHTMSNQFKMMSFNEGYAAFSAGAPRDSYLCPGLYDLRAWRAGWDESQAMASTPAADWSDVAVSLPVKAITSPLVEISDYLKANGLDATIHGACVVVQVPSLRSLSGGRTAQYMQSETVYSMVGAVRLVLSMQ